MDSSENNELLLPEKGFFDLVEEDKTLAEIITRFHTVAKNLDIIPVIENETEEAYYKYRFEDVSEPGIDISVYTPVPSEKITKEDLTNQNTRAIRRHSYRNVIEKINPIEKEDHKKRYLEMLQLVIATGLQRKLDKTNQ